MRIYTVGSTTFVQHMVQVTHDLRRLGCDAWIHPVYEEEAEGKHSDQLDRYANGEHASVKLENDYPMQHGDHIMAGDAILVVNDTKNGVKNYVGPNVLMEMYLAFYHGKSIYFLNGMPTGLPWLAEIEAMRPVCLYGDLTKLPKAGEKICDHRSVGMLVRRNDRILLIERKKFPFGFAPPAGHVDGDLTFEIAAQRELKEESGLLTISLELIWSGTLANPCRRPNGDWHYWKVYDMLAHGDLALSADETKRGGWYGPYGLGELAQRTERRLAGEISDGDWEENPGLEPVWYGLFKKIGGILP